MPPIDATRTGIRLTIHVQPRAASDQVVGLHGDAIKIRLAATPIDGAANQALIGLLSKRLAVPRATLRIAAGTSARRKIVEAGGVTVEEARRRLGIGAPAGA